MSNQSGLPPMMPINSGNNDPSGPRLSWSDAWAKALTQPSVESFEEIANSTPESNNTAYLWIFVVSIISSIIRAALSTAFASSLGSTQQYAYSPGTTIITGLICSPVIGAISVLFFAIYIGITQAIAGALDGTGSYRKLLYTAAAYAAPLSLVTAVLGSIPLVNCLTLPLGLYSIYLNVLSVKAVNQFGWGKAILSSFVIWIVVVVLIAVVIIVILAILGPSIGEIFSNITRSL
ncbi:MAG: YIP1 family protein [Chloroflexota bacterium]